MISIRGVAWRVGAQVVLSVVASGLAIAAGPPDSDGDGVPDSADAFPCDAASSAEAYAPSLGVHGLVLAEDYWPVRLDDDYQDSVIAYNYGAKLDASGNVSSLRVSLDVLAAGGVIDLGIGLRLPLSASTPHIASGVIGNRALALGNPGDAMLTMVLISDVRSEVFPGAGTGIINARVNQAAVPNAGPIELDIDFSPPVVLPLSAVPFDLYVFRAGDPRHEEHLSQYCGTANMNTRLFGTGIDASTPPGGPCFVDFQGLPTLLDIPQTALYPLESTNIASLYPNIVAWAASGGAVNQDWFTIPVPSFAYPTPLSPQFNGVPQIVDPAVCACPSGFTGTGGSCSDVDECLAGTANCSVNATCTNNQGGFSCACNAGYAGNGVTCTDVNECTNGTNNCSANATCSNTAGSYTCACNAGYSGNGVTCTDVNECTNGTNNCSVNATCTNTTGSFACACNAGFTGNGVTCTDINECTNGTANCGLGATCTNTPGSYTCACNPEFSQNGASCMPRTCRSLRLAGITTSGQYTVDPDGTGPIASFNTYCDMTTDGGGWTLVMYVVNGYLNMTTALNQSSLPSRTVLSKVDDAVIRATAAAVGSQREALVDSAATKYILRYPAATWAGFSSVGWTNVFYDAKDSSGTWWTNACNGHWNNRGVSTWNDVPYAPCNRVFFGPSRYMTQFHTFLYSGGVGGIFGIYLR